MDAGSCRSPRLPSRPWVELSERDHAQGFAVEVAGPSFAETLARCPFRTVIGRWPAPVTFSCALMDGGGLPFSEAQLAEMLAEVRRGGTVLLMSDNEAIRNRAKAVLTALLRPCAGNV